MKKILFTVAVLLVSFSTIAQEGSAFRKELRDFVELQSSGTIDATLAQVLTMVPQEKHEALKKEVKAKMPELYEQTVDLYIKRIGKEDLMKMLAFYETPAGKRIAEKTPELLNESMQIGQQWGAITLQPILRKYMGQ